MCLESGIAVASNCSSDLTPSLGTSVCRASTEAKKKKALKKKAKTNNVYNIDLLTKVQRQGLMVTITTGEQVLKCNAIINSSPSGPLASSSPSPKKAECVGSRMFHIFIYSNYPNVHLSCPKLHLGVPITVQRKQI